MKKIHRLIFIIPFFLGFTAVFSAVLLLTADYKGGDLKYIFTIHTLIFYIASGLSCFYLIFKKDHFAVQISLFSAAVSILIILLYIYSGEYSNINFIEFYLFENSVSNLYFLLSTLYLLLSCYTACFIQWENDQTIEKHLISWFFSVSSSFIAAILFCYFLEYKKSHNSDIFNDLFYINAAGLFIVLFGMKLIKFNFSENCFVCRMKFAGILVSSISIFLLTFFSNIAIFSEIHKINGDIIFKTNSFGDILNFEFHQRMLAFERMSERWENSSNVDINAWKLDAASYIEDMPGFELFCLLDENGYIIFKTPDSSGHAGDKNISYKRVLETSILYPSIRSEHMLISDMISLQNQDHVFLISHQMKKQKFNIKTMVAVVNIKDYVNDLIKKYNSFTDFGMMIIRNGDIIYKNGTSENESYYSSSKLLDFNDTWTLYFYLYGNKADFNKKIYVISLLFSGFVMSFLIVVLFWLWSKNVLKSKELEIEKIKSDEANVAKSKFLSNMSHELRTPLNAILGFTQLLMTTKNDTNTSQNYLSIIFQAGKNLINLINEILDLSKIEAGKMEIKMEKVSCRHIIENSLVLIEEQAFERDIKINVFNCKNHNVHANLNKASQVFINLMTNAIKYNKKGGTVEVMIEVINNILRISVTDTGDGIPEELKEKIFVPFTRLTINSDHVEGTGIGLALSKQLMKQMGGNMGFTSEVGKGSRFWMDMKLID